MLPPFDEGYPHAFSIKELGVEPSDFLLRPEIFEIILCNGQLVFYAPLHWGKKWPKNNKILRIVMLLSL